jgi:hypothetical protein
MRFGQGDPSGLRDLRFFCIIQSLYLNVAFGREVIVALAGPIGLARTRRMARRTRERLPFSLRSKKVVE